MDRLVQLDVREAVRAYFDSRNCRVLFQLLILFAGATLAGAVAMLALERIPRLALALAMLIVIRLLYATRERAGFIRHFRPVFLGYLSVQLLVLRGLFYEASITPIEILLPFLLLFFRLRWTQLIVPLAVLWAASAGNHLLTARLSGAPVDLWAVIGQSAIPILVLVIGNRLAETMHRSFLDN